MLAIYRVYSERIAWALLAIAAIASLVLVLFLIFETDSAMRDYLFEHHVLEATIGFLGIIFAAFVAALALLYINMQTLTYSWKRDQALKDVERIFEPLYHDVTYLASMSSNLDYHGVPLSNWESIRDSYLGRKLELSEQGLYSRLLEIFNLAEEYRDKQLGLIRMVDTIAATVIESRLDETIDLETRQLILRDMPSTLDWERKVYRGFLLRKTLSEVALKYFTEGKQRLLGFIMGILLGKGYWKQQQFTSEELENMLNEVYRIVQGDRQISKELAWFMNFHSESVKVKKELEDRILKPQLP